MAKNYVEDGNTMDWTNAGAADVKSGDMVVVGDLVGVAVADIPVSGDGVLLMTGVFSLPKSGVVTFEQGEKVYAVADGITNDPGSAPLNPVAGTAWRAAAASDVICWVRLGF